MGRVCSWNHRLDVQVGQNLLLGKFSNITGGLAGAKGVLRALAGARGLLRVLLAGAKGLLRVIIFKDEVSVSITFRNFCS